MKTKNVLVLMLIIIAGLLNVKEVKAEGPTESATLNLNIVLNPIQTITVTATQKSVDLIYKTEDNYESGVSVKQNDHLKIFSTGGFTVSVESDGNLSNGEGKVIESTDVTILAENGTGNEVLNTTTGAVALGGEKTLITSDSGGRDLMYNVTYNNKTGTKDKYINLYKNNGGNTFTATVTYTIAAK